jgi:predicted RND superfamily exporter protein
MKKRFTAIIMVLCLVFSLFTVTTSATSKVSKYVKVKTATYQKYKKAYNENKKLKTQIKELKSENKKLKEELKKIDELKQNLEQQKGINNWLWMSLSSLGISYSNKTWSVPKTFPETFIINGAKYKVVIQEEE